MYSYSSVLSRETRSSTTLSGVRVRRYAGSPATARRPRRRVVRFPVPLRGPHAQRVQIGFDHVDAEEAVLIEVVQRVRPVAQFRSVRSGKCASGTVICSISTVLPCSARPLTNWNTRAPVSTPNTAATSREARVFLKSMRRDDGMALSPSRRTIRKKRKNPGRADAWTQTCPSPDDGQDVLGTEFVDRFAQRADRHTEAFGEPLSEGMHSPLPFACREHSRSRS